MIPVIFDTETTDKEPELAMVVQLGVLKGNALGETPEIIMNALCDPEIPIPPESTEVHGIEDADVELEPMTEVIIDQFISYLGTLQFPVLVGHNIAYYDLPVVKRVRKVLGDFPYIDTCLMARRMYPNAKSHKLTDMYVMLGGDMDPEGAHDAVYDCILNHFVFEEMLKKSGMTVQQFWEYSMLPVAYKTMPFGKHKGKVLSHSLKGYLGWCEKNFDNLDLDFQRTVDIWVHGEKEDEANQ